jgi:hypothetical protein
MQGKSGNNLGSMTEHEGAKAEAAKAALHGRTGNFWSLIMITYALDQERRTSQCTLSWKPVLTEKMSRNSLRLGWGAQHKSGGECVKKGLQYSF